MTIQLDDDILALVSVEAVEGELQDEEILVPAVKDVPAIMYKSKLVVYTKKSANGETETRKLRADLMVELLDATVREVVKRDRVYVNITMYLNTTPDGKFDMAGNVQFVKMFKAFGLEKADLFGKSPVAWLTMITFGDVEVVDKTGEVEKVSKVKEINRDADPASGLLVRVNIKHRKIMSQESGYKEPELDAEGREKFRAEIDGFARV